METQPLLLYDVPYPERLSRLLIFIKWLLVIPHAIVLTVLGFAFGVTTFIAWFGILFTGNYPRSLWDFGMMTMRWVARVNAYLYLQRDEYPPFGDAPYPVDFEMAYPPRLSRLLIFVKWLLIIPHYIVLYFLNIAVGVVLLIAWFAILITGNFPRSFFDFLNGFTRWNYRALMYLLLMTDAYPPFSFDQPAAPPTSYYPVEPRPTF